MKLQLKLLFSWLNNVRLGDYIDILSKTAKDVSTSTASLVHEVQNAFINIQMTLEKSQVELFKKEIKASIGFIPTKIPILLSTSETLPPEL